MQNVLFQNLAKVYYPNLGFPLKEGFPLEKEGITLEKEIIPLIRGILSKIEGNS